MINLKNNSVVINNDKRLVGLDVLRIICAMLIVLRHSITMAGLSYSFFNNPILYLTTPVMVMFFTLSGFTMQYTYGQKSFFSGNTLLKFYAKRWISIYPLYLLIHFICCFIVECEMDTKLKLFPIEIIGNQTWFTSLFGVFHNGGTWFVSCLFLAYFIFPLIQQILSLLTAKQKWLLLVSLLFVIIYSQQITAWFKLADLYSNPLFRCLEFIVGMILCDIKITKKTVLIADLVVGIVGLYLCYVFDVWQMQIVCICLICLGVSVFSAQKNANAKFLIKLIEKLSEMSYAVYMVQIFVWPIYFAVLSVVPIEKNVYRIILAWGLIYGLAFLIHEIYEKPIQKFLKNRLGR